MKGIFKNYGGTIALLAGVCAGAVTGVLWPSAAHFVKGIGVVFLNLLFALVVPMVFFSISLAFFRLKSRKQVGNLLLKAFTAFMVLWLCCGILSYISTLVANPLGDMSGGTEIPETGQSEAQGSSFMLFSKIHLLPLIIFSAIFGIAVACVGDKGRSLAAFLEYGDKMVAKAMGILMKAAPIGLGCYFADTVASIGGGLLEGYLRILIIYCILAVIYLFCVFPLLVGLSLGRKGLKSFVRNIIPPTVTAFATASSSIAMPGNIEAAEKTGIDSSIAQSVVPLATNLLKAGSSALDVIKVVFLMTLCNQVTVGIVPFVSIIAMAILSALVSGAVTNGGVSGELLICSMLGVNPEMAGIIMIIGTIADIPATLVNSQSTVVAAAMASYTAKNEK